MFEEAGHHIVIESPGTINFEKPNREFTHSKLIMAEKGSNREDREQEDDLPEEEETAQAPSPKKKKRNARKKKQKEELKSKATGTGLKISVDSAPKKNKIVFDDSNLPSEDDDDNDDKDSTNNQRLNAGLASQQDESDDDDAVEEVKGTAARDEALDQLETEAKQSLKTKKKRKRKPRKEKVEKDYDDEDAEMDDDFFAQLDSVREAEMKEQQALDESAAREAMKGKHTTFVFAKNKSDEDGSSDPVDINENIQVVVLNNSNIGEKDALSEKALTYSRNRLTSGADPLEGAAELKRKRMRSGPEIQPWKRAKKGLAMGRSRLRKGKPSAFFKRKR